MCFYLLIVSQVALCIIKPILTMIELHAEVTGEFVGELTQRKCIING